MSTHENSEEKSFGAREKREKTRKKMEDEQ